MLNQRTILLFVALSGFCYVMLGAMGAHMLAPILSQKEAEWLKTALQYQGFHTLALLAICVLMSFKPSRLLTFSAIAMVLGIFFFCGSLYLLIYSTDFISAYFTPLGGVFFLLGWIFLFLFALNEIRKQS